MRLLSETWEWDETIKLARELDGSYDKPVIFHCYWTGIPLNERHLYSVLSCYYFNVLNRNHKIILWIEGGLKENDITNEIRKYCDIKDFSMGEEKNRSEINEVKGTINIKDGKDKRFRADFIRCLLLYNYGGCWFDLDCFFLRSFDPMFRKFENEVCLYQWTWWNYPNNAIFISLEPKSDKLKDFIVYVKNRSRGWGCQQASLTFDLPLDILVLPAAWFEATHMAKKDPELYKFHLSSLPFHKPNENIWNFDNFFKGSFCYHWHNSWTEKIEDGSACKQLVQIINSKMGTNY